MPQRQLKMQRTLHNLSVASLVLVLLVMTAGSIVRMTGSGMGCPDWPKCFGYYIPPTSIETLNWKAGRSFEEGNIIIREESLLVAVKDFTAGASFNEGNWESYTKHDYAHFDPLHTWIEFINRLIGVLAGVPAVVLLLLSLFYLRSDYWVFILALLGIFLLGFAAWLGKLVVDGNLIPHSITYHMFSALALLLVYVGLIVRLTKVEVFFTPMRNRIIIWLGVLGLLLLLVQIGLGTTVREQVDLFVKSGDLHRPNWIENLDIYFKIHRSFSIAVFITVGAFALMVIQSMTISTWPRLILTLLIAEVLAGVGLAYLGIPASLQPVHLLLAALTVALNGYVLMLYWRKTRAA